MSVAGTFDDILASYGAMPQEQKDLVLNNAKALTEDKKGLPNPGPQTEAYFSEADELFYGGAAGGGKTYLACLLALNEHEKSLMLRRISKNLRGMKRELEALIGSTAGLNSQEGIWRHDGGVIDLGHCEHEKSKEGYQGVPHDLKVFDEITQFTETQYTYIIGWNRSANPNQRCRVLVTGNPPNTPEGLWVIKRWGPWLDPTHPNPAKPGELRWFTTIDGKDLEVSKEWCGPDGEKPKSRTFILSLLTDNPDLADTGYGATIDAMPEPLRTMLKEGRFDLGQQDDEWQVIPSEWLRLAQARWKEDGWRGNKMTAMAVDVAQGGTDATVLARRYGPWFAPLLKHEGHTTPDGPSVAGLVVAARKDICEVIVDVGGGYGGGVVTALKQNAIEAKGYNGSEAGKGKTADGQLEFYNKRAETHWRLREALDPGQEGGSVIAIPPDPQLFADLTAPRWELTTRGIKVELKVDIKKRIGRSTDDGDAVIMAWAEGERMVAKRTKGGSGPGGEPKVKLGYAHMKRGRGR